MKTKLNEIPSFLAWASTNDPTLPPLYTRAHHGLVQTTVANVGQKPQALPCVQCALQACIFARCTYGIHQKLKMAAQAQSFAVHIQSTF